MPPPVIVEFDLISNKILLNCCDSSNSSHPIPGYDSCVKCIQKVRCVYYFVIILLVIVITYMFVYWNVIVYKFISSVGLPHPVGHMIIRLLSIRINLNNTVHNNYYLLFNIILFSFRYIALPGILYHDLMLLITFRS